MFEAEWDADHVLQDLADLAGAVAQRRLMAEGVTHIEHLTADQSEAVLRSAWREAASQYFPSADPKALAVAVDELLDAMIDNRATEMSAPPSRFN